MRDGSYSVSHAFGRPSTRSVSRIPPMVPWVIPCPESPVHRYTLARPDASRPMNARKSKGSITIPDQRSSATSMPKRGRAQATSRS